MSSRISIRVYPCASVVSFPRADNLRVEAAGDELAVDFGEARGADERLGLDRPAAPEKIRHQRGRRHPVSPLPPGQPVAILAEVDEHHPPTRSQHAAELAQE